MCGAQPTASNRISPWVLSHPPDVQVDGFFVSTADVRLKEITHMKKSKLSVRVNRKNPNHHLWNNNGKWWCHHTLHHSDFTAERKRVPLHTRDVIQARKRRDELFLNLQGITFQKEVLRRAYFNSLPAKSTSPLLPPRRNCSEPLCLRPCDSIVVVLPKQRGVWMT